MVRALPLIALLLLGCGAGSTSTEPAASAATTPSAAATSVPAVHSDVDSSKPYSVRGDK